jgi:hypothetical protein
MRTTKNIKLCLLLLFSFTSIPFFAQDSGGGGGTTNIWEPDLVELWIYWHKTQYKMFSDFALNEDTLQRVKYLNYMNFMDDLAKVDATLFSQYQNNDVPRPEIFTSEILHVALLVNDIKDSFTNTFTMLNEPPVHAHCLQMFEASSIEMLLKITNLYVSSKKVMEDRKAYNLRDNRLRDDLLNNIMRELQHIKNSLNSLYVRMRTAKNELLLHELLN